VLCWLQLSESIYLVDLACNALSTREIKLQRHATVSGKLHQSKKKFYPNAQGADLIHREEDWQQQRKTSRAASATAEERLCTGLLPLFKNIKCFRFVK